LNPSEIDGDQYGGKEAAKVVVRQGVAIERIEFSSGTAVLEDYHY
jgi:hypothetical protein